MKVKPLLAIKLVNFSFHFLLSFQQKFLLFYLVNLNYIFLKLIYLELILIIFLPHQYYLFSFLDLQAFV